MLGARWKPMPPLSWGADDFAAGADVTANLTEVRPTALARGPDREAQRPAPRTTIAL